MVTLTPLLTVSFIGSIIRGRLQKKLIDGIGDVSEDQVALLRELDLYSVTTVAKTPPKVLAKEPVFSSMLKTEDITLGWEKNEDSDGDWTKKPVKRRNIKLGSDFAISILREDDLFGVADTTFYRVLRFQSLFPLENCQVLADDGTALDLARLFKVSPRDEGQASPTPYHDWKEMTSDGAMTRIFFYGIGSVLTAAQQAGAADSYPDLGPFVIDMPMQDLGVRRGYQRYGQRIHFNAKQEITAIYNYADEKLVKPGEGEAWERAKHLAKSTALALITVREHLLWTHLLAANTIARTKTDTLPPNHPIRRLLSVFTFRTNFINRTAQQALIPRRSLVHRGSAFTYKSIKKVFSDGVKASNIFEPFAKRTVIPELQTLSNQNKFPYIAEGKAFYSIVEGLVEEWLSHVEDIEKDDLAKSFYEETVKITEGMAYTLPSEFSKQNLVDLLTQTIFTVTAYHEVVGTVVDYTEKPSFMGLRSLADPKTTNVDLQSYFLSSVLTASTALRMPKLISDFPNYFGAGGAPAWERTSWDNFQKKLKDQSKVVKAANARRAFDCKSFDPEVMECAVSL